MCCDGWQATTNVPFHLISYSEKLPPPCQDGLTLLIGYHELHGKEVPLKSPLVVLKKHTAADRGDDTLQPHQRAHDLSEGAQTSVLYVVEGIIRRKFIFKSRPKALISSKIMYPVSNFSQCGSFSIYTSHHPWVACWETYRLSPERLVKCLQRWNLHQLWAKAVNHCMLTF